MEYVQWGLPVVLAMFPESSSQKNAVKYFPLVEDALNGEGLLDLKMKLVAYATIRAETAGFKPIDEGECRFNTLRPVDVSNLSDPGLRALGDISKALVGQYGLDNKFGKYDYRDKRPNKSGRLVTDLGNSARGDGELYKGRGFIQLTGKSNYLEFSKLLRIPELATHPDSAMQPEIAAKVFARFIKRARSKISKAIATGDLAAARSAVNGGDHGLDRFLEAYDRGCQLALPRDRAAGMRA